MWHYTHNSYAELSSETGIPGFVLFIMALFGAYRGLSPIRKRYPDLRVRRAALFTQMAVLMTSVGAFFLSMSYGGIIVVIIATSATLQAAVANKTKLARRQAVGPPDDWSSCRLPGPFPDYTITQSLLSPKSVRRTLGIVKVWAHIVEHGSLRLCRLPSRIRENADLERIKRLGREMYPALLR